MHVPKTAGTSLNYVIENNFGLSQVCQMKSFTNFHDFRRWSELGVQYVGGHIFYDIARQVIGNPLVPMTVLRDPVERTISNFYHLKRHYSFPDNRFDYQRFKDLTIEEYLEDANLLNEVSLFNSQMDHLAARFDAHRLQESPDVRDISRAADVPRDLDAVKTLLKSFAFVGVAERFQESMDLLAYTFGWTPWCTVPLLNISTDRVRAGELPPRLADRIRSLNAMDQALCDDARELFDRRYLQMTDELVAEFGADPYHLSERPLPRPQLLLLLEEHYDRQFAWSHPVEPEIEVNFNGPMSGTGWYPAEADPNTGTFRWIGPRPTATLDLRLGRDRDACIKVRVISAPDDSQLERFAVRVNGHRVELVARTPPDGGIEFSGLATRSMLATGRSFVRLEFSVSHTIPASRIDPQQLDDREIGVAIQRVAVTPVRP